MILADVSFTDPSGVNPLQIKDLEVLFKNVVGILLGLGGVIFFVMLIIGGFSFMAAGGDPKALEQAKKTLTYAIGGMIFLALALLIFKIIEVFTGVDLLKFRITQ